MHEEKMHEIKDEEKINNNNNNNNNSSQEFWDADGSSNLGQTTRHSDRQ